MFKKNLAWLIPFGLILILALYSPVWDMHIAAYFYRDNFIPSTVVQFLYDYGPIPGLALGFGSLFVLILSYIFKRFRSFRSPAWVLVLTVGLGAGIIVHNVFKDHWGRPRPRQVIEFGGKYPYRPIYKPDFSPPELLRSFPCGHCTMGFCFFACGILAYHYSYYTLMILSYFAALAIGLFMGYARMAQGGHFFSDVIMTAVIMWLCSYGFYKLIYRSQAVI